MPFGSWCIQTTKEHWFTKGSAWVGMGRESFWLCWSTKLSLPWLICVEISSLDELRHSLESPHWFQWVLAPLSKPDSAVVTEITELHKDLLTCVHFWSELSGAGLTHPSQTVLQPRLQWHLHPSPPVILYQCLIFLLKGLWNYKSCCHCSSLVLAKINIHVQSYPADHEKPWKKGYM